jgi:hypothetical protein
VMLDFQFVLVSKRKIDDIVAKYFYCSREDYRKENGAQVDDQSIK